MTLIRLLPVAAALSLLAATGTARAESFNTCAGFIDALPATISTQGTWCLRQDLATAITNGTAIQINTNNVTIDCNGFKIGGLAAGPATLTYGLYAHTRQNITVRNCSVRGFRVGLYLFGTGMVVEDNRFDTNYWKAIGVFGEANRVLRNMVVDTGGGDGITVGVAIHAAADVTDNYIYNVFGDDALANTGATGIDIYTGRGRVVRGNNIQGLLSAGTGRSLGVHVESASATVIEHNNMSRTGVPNGYGILAEGSHAFCNDNTTYNFATATSGCSISTGNQNLP